MSANVEGTSPELEETPALLNKIHFAAFGETVGHCWVPVVHRAGVMLVEDQRNPVRPAEATIGETNAVGLDELRWRSLVSVSHFWRV
jgi:hypothetical protein